MIETKGAYRLAVMLGRSFLLSALLAGSIGSGEAGALDSELMRPQRDRAGAGIQLAQSGDIEVYYDRQGNRVMVDAWSGQVIAIERSRHVQRRELAPVPPEDRYYLDDPEDMARYRRDRMRRLGRALPPVEEYDDYYPEEFPEAPRDSAMPAPAEQDPMTGATIQRDQIVRAPLEAPLPPEDSWSSDMQPRDEFSDPTGGISKPPEAIVPPATFGSRTEVAELQVLLDRVGASPGVIDGRMGDNVNKAISAYRELKGEALRTYDKAAITAALEETGGPAFVDYTITPQDAAGPFVASVPDDYGEKAKLDRLSYTSVTEMLAERFHMDEAYLKALNPEANFNRPGTIIKVANIGQPVAGQVSRIIADKGRKQVRAYDASGKLMAIYPSTIGSSDTPSPSGVHIVSRVAFDPNYTYNPKLNFKQGNNDKILTIPPGPNGPVGSIWIALDKPTYGIHGTPEPSKIGKTESHGCVRLTNWDAQELAKMVSKGVSVEFLD